MLIKMFTVSWPLIAVVTVIAESVLGIFQYRVNSKLEIRHRYNENMFCFVAVLGSSLLTISLILSYGKKDVVRLAETLAGDSSPFWAPVAATIDFSLLFVLMIAIFYSVGYGFGQWRRKCLLYEDEFDEDEESSDDAK